MDNKSVTARDHRQRTFDLIVEESAASCGSTTAFTWLFPEPWGQRERCSISSCGFTGVRCDNAGLTQSYNAFAVGHLNEVDSFVIQRPRVVFENKNFRRMDDFIQVLAESHGPQSVLFLPPSKMAFSRSGSVTFRQAIRALQTLEEKRPKTGRIGHAGPSGTRDRGRQRHDPSHHRLRPSPGHR